ncbi:MAG TPA: AAA family ATPase [Solirubrobacteraceae bacterium]|nr:AAA family ATPase [Solirubrobacteraceae bacterium]
MLLEREGALAELGAVLSRARNAHGRVVLVEGPAGIGKTRLLDECRGRGRSLGLEVLTARGGPFERGYGFGVARQLLEPALACASAGDRRELLSGAAALAAPVFSSDSAPAEETIATHSVLHGLYWLVANMAERSPLLLVTDDAHWADGPSLRFLLYLARRLEGMPVALVMALRTGEAGADTELLRSLRVEASSPVIEPGALSPQATQTLTTARLGRAVPDELARACHAATGGNPFLLTELLHQLRGAPEEIDPGAVEGMASERVAAAILLRVARVGAPATALVRAMSVLGESATLELAAELAGLDRLAATALADALVNAQIVAPEGSSRQLRFVHALVRGAIYEDIPRADRAKLHARTAELLVRDRRDTGAAAMHLLVSEPAGEEATVRLLRDAARAEMGRGAPETAAEFLRRAEREAAPETAHAELLFELGVAASRAGLPDGVQLLRDAFIRTSEQPARARVGLELAFALGVSSGESEAVIDVLERAGENLHDERLRALLDARLVMFCILLPSASSRLSGSLAGARAALERPARDVPRVLLGPLAADLLVSGAPAADVCRLAERALEGGELMRHDVEMESDFGLGALLSLCTAGSLRSARQHVDDAIAHARTCGSRSGLARLCAHRALVWLRLGELASAESDAQFALSVDAAWGIPHAISSAVLAQVQIERGDLDGAQRYLERIDADPAVLEVRPNQMVRETRAALSLAQGRPRDALTQLRSYAHWEQRSGQARLGPVAWRSLAAEAHRQLGEIDEARTLAARHLQLAREFGAAPQLGAALRSAAVVGGGPAGLEMLDEAVSVLEPSAARLEFARAVVERGALLRRCGERNAATDALRAGMDLANRCGATALVQTAAAELRLTGARPRRIATHGRESLTPGEHRVSDLAADGMSNKQIAQALFVTLRTVEMHLSNSYRKLGIASREQLPAALRAS